MAQMENSVMEKLRQGTRGSCPALAVYQTCHACVFVSACPYKSSLGDYGAEQGRADAAVLRAVNDRIACVSDETATDAARLAAADELVADLRNADLPPHVHARIAVALGERGDVRAFEALGETLLDARLTEQYAALREEAALALGDLGDARAVGVLSQMLEDWRPSIRFACVVALGRLGEPTAIERLHAAHGQRLGDDFGRFNDQVQEMTLFSLALLGDRDVRRPLEAMLTNEDRLTLSRAEIVFALGELNDAAALPALKAFQESGISEGLQRYVAIALGRLGCNEARERLIEFLPVREGDIGVHAARALATLGDERAIDTLAMRGLTSPLGYVRRLAAQDLLKLPSLNSRRLAKAYLEHEPVASIRSLIGRQLEATPH
jgi:HEAT repeat protein